MLETLYRRGIHGSHDRTDVIPRLSLYSIHNTFTCYRDDEHAMTAAEEGGVVPLPFSCAFSKHSSSQHVVAVANEDGKVHLIDTRKSKDSLLRTWQAHVNAVFDIAWVEGDYKLVTGSGDQTAQLWDVTTTKCISVFKGHTCSLRSISFKPNHPNVFATGARDGNIMIWDTRTRPMKSGHYKPVNIIHGVHNTITTGASSRRNNSARPTESQQSVTSVLYRDEHHLYSSGAADGTIKMWDTRRYYTTAKGVPQPKHSYPYVGTGARKHGISSLSITRCGSRLFSSCTDDSIYMYNTHLDSRDPVGVFTGHTNSTFYVKSTVSLDDQYLISGSSSHSVFIWDINKPGLPPVKLEGHTGEVTSVASSPSDIGLIVSCSDDNTVRLWRMQDQTDLCKEGSKCGTATPLVNHSAVDIATLNLTEPGDKATTPDRATRGRATPSNTPSNRTPSSRATPSNRGRRLLTPSRSRDTARDTARALRSTPIRSGRLPGRLLGDGDDEQPSSSGETTTNAMSKDLLTPTRASPRLQAATPGKISSYFRSSDKKQQSPTRSSPRLNNLLKGKSRVGGLKLEKAEKLNNAVRRLGDSLKTPTKSMKETSDETTEEEAKSPKKGPRLSPKNKHPVKKRNMAEDNEPDHVTSPSEDVTSHGVTIATQTLTPEGCMSSCRTCCKHYTPPPLCPPVSSHTPLLTSAPDTGTPTPAPRTTELTPRSCSSSSIPRPKRIHRDVTTTPTKGAGSPQAGCVRRKFTKTGTPIHRYNCRCTFCISAATELSELSSSPILEMPCRPRKRLLSHEEALADISCPKKRKSLFSAGSESDGNTIQSCSPTKEEEKENRSNKQQITVTRYLSGRINSKDDTSKSGPENQDQNPEEKQDHSECSGLHCIRCYFTKK